MPETIKRPVGRPRKNPLPTTEPQVAHTDDWQNSLTGLGGNADKTAYTVYGKATLLDDGTLTEMYMGDGLASRIVNVVAQDSTREWVYLPDEKQRETINPVLETLNAEEKFCDALTWSRLYGGSIIIMGLLDGRTVDQPLNEKAIRGIEYLKVIDRTCILIPESEYDTDINSPTFGKILKFKVRYMIQNVQYDMMIHHTRVVEFHNDAVPMGRFYGMTEDTRYFGISSLQIVFESLANLGSIVQSTASVLQNFTSTTLKFRGLAQLLAADANGTAEIGLRKRLNAVMATQSVFNCTVIDQEETVEHHYTSLAGIPETMDRYMLLLSGATSIPVTRLFGKSPSGLGANSENDTRNYYDLIEASQRIKLLPPLRRLIKLIALIKGIQEEVPIEFNSLYQLSEEEKAKIAFLEAQTNKMNAEAELLYIEAGIRDGEQVAIEHGWQTEWEEPEEDVVETKPPTEVTPDDSTSQ